MTGRRPKAEQLCPRHNIFSPVFAALPSHPNLRLPPLKVTLEPVSSPQFSKQLIDTSVTLQHAREVFWDTETVFPDRKYSAYLPFWFIHSDETLRTPPKGKEWTAASFHCPLSQPAAGHLGIAGSQCQCKPGTTGGVWSWCFSTGSSEGLQARTFSLSLTRRRSQAHPVLLYTLSSFYPSTVQGVSLLFLPTLSHTLKASSGFGNEMLTLGPGQPCLLVL